MMKNGLEGLDIFVAVAELSSFSQAANKLKVSKAHVSRQITALEQRLKANLFIRSTRNVQLTDAGMSLYSDTQAQIKQLYQAQHQFFDRYHQPTGELKISVAGGFGEEVIAPVAQAFLVKYPDTKVDIHFSNEQVDLFRGEADLAIRSGVLEDSSLIARKVASRNLVTCASPEFYRQHGIPQTPQSLSQFNCLLGSTDTWYYHSQASAFPVTGNWRSNNARTLVSAALSGLGLIQVPDFYLQEALESGQLISCLEEFQPKGNAIWAVYTPSHKLSIKVQKFIDLLIAHVRQ